MTRKLYQVWQGMVGYTVENEEYIDQHFAVQRAMLDAVEVDGDGNSQIREIGYRTEADGCVSYYFYSGKDARYWNDP